MGVSKRWPRALPNYLTDEALNALLERPMPVRDRALVEVQYGCGLRLLELERLEWSNIDLEERILHVPMPALDQPWLQRFLVMNRPSVEALEPLAKTGKPFGDARRRLRRLGLEDDTLRFAYGVGLGRAGASPDGIRHLMGLRNVSDVDRFFIRHDVERLCRLYGL